MASMMIVLIIIKYRGYGFPMRTMFTGLDKHDIRLYYIDDNSASLRGRLLDFRSGNTFTYGILDTNYRYDVS
jgi:20S proteasome subunit beta 5